MGVASGLQLSFPGYKSVAIEITIYFDHLICLMICTSMGVASGLQLSFSVASRLQLREKYLNHCICLVIHTRLRVSSESQLSFFQLQIDCN
jgi:hypothetical protein